MGILAAPSAIHPELLAECVHKEIALRAHLRIRPDGPPTIKRSKHPQHQRPTSTHQNSKRRSSKRAETSPGKNDQGDKVQRLRNWKQSMVGRNEHQKALRQQETIPKAIWTFRGSRQFPTSPTGSVSLKHGESTTCFTHPFSRRTKKLTNTEQTFWNRHRN